MFRSFFVSLSHARWAQRTITHWGFAWKAASRFIAGETIADAIQVVRQLNGAGIRASLDHLGENTLNPGDVDRAAGEIISILEEIDQAGIQSNVSIKLSQIGLMMDENLCQQYLEKILVKAEALGIFVRVDMEDSTTTERTIQAVRQAFLNGHENVGVVLQAYLRRSEKDVADMIAHPVRIRLCKGAYLEPASIAYPDKADVDANYDHLCRMLLEGVKAAGAPPVSPDGKTPPLAAIATHDLQRINFTRKMIDELGLPRAAVEFQMLYGIHRDLQAELVAAGYPMRVYVPYGTQWYPYFMRRLGERPANVWFFLSNYFRR
jgi:proline dehydrogenase